MGIASSHLRGAGNIGYIIPGKIVAMFLSMCRDGMNASVEERFSGLGSLVERGNSNPSQEDGDGMDGSEMEQYPKHVPGIPELAIHGAQTLESKALRRSLGLDLLGIPGGIRIIGVRGSKLHGGGEEGGKDCSEGVCNAKKRKYGDDDGDGAIMDEPNNDAVVVRDKHKTTNGVDTTTNEECNKQTTKDQLQANDVLLSINRIPIGMDGTIQLSPTRPDERINFRSVVTCQRVGSEVELDVLRDRRIKKMKVVLDTSRFLVPQYDGFDACPLYVVCGGCVFCESTWYLVLHAVLCIYFCSSVKILTC